MIAYRIKSWRDELGIKREMQMLAYTALVCVALLTVVNLLFEAQILCLLDAAVTAVGTSVCNYVSLMWVWMKYQQQQQQQQSVPLRVTKFAQQQQQQSDPADDAAGAAVTAPKNQLDLARVLQSKDGFDAFALHCVKEFNVENLLFICEAMHFKYECQKLGVVSPERQSIWLELPVKTKRVLQHKNIAHNLHDLMDHYRYLYRKYLSMKTALDLDNELAVNVSCEVRTRMNKCFESCILAESGFVAETPTKPDLMTRVATFSERSRVDFDIPRFDMTFKTNSASSECANDNDEYDDMMPELLQCVQTVDDAMREVFKMINGDTFRRFKELDVYGKIVQKIVKRRLSYCRDAE
eukprot:CAMPEP_0202733470 /NCGR_PEP_ID=MMETSP1385-20130828/188183_1 /ASSEMBLY_ACC=CAM_ASM_000861 /TAXON_ID=933848 /ORGANISM="Elphidium margaritaceum" /LENGTH=351 /DNA_ID=CAMNT_0049399803 /DNA_START=516 /DNA_END=1572 /DNA_ORIENTATION=+